MVRPVDAAVPWFRHAGPQLLSATLHGRTYVDGTEPDFSVPRWTFWRSRFEANARRGDRAAEEGLRLMKQYDGRIAARF